MPRILAFCPKRPLINVGSPVGHTAASYQITKPVRFFPTRASRASLLSLAGWLAEPDGSSYRTYIQVAILLSDDWPSMSAGSLIIIPLEQFWSHKIWVYSSTAALKFAKISLDHPSESRRYQGPNSQSRCFTRASDIPVLYYYNYFLARQRIYC